MTATVHTAARRVKVKFRAGRSCERGWLHECCANTWRVWERGGFFFLCRNQPIGFLLGGHVTRNRPTEKQRDRWCTAPLSLSSQRTQVGDSIRVKVLNFRKWKMEKRFCQFKKTIFVYFYYLFHFKSAYVMVSVYWLRKFDTNSPGANAINKLLSIIIIAMLCRNKTLILLFQV